MFLNLNFVCLVIVRDVVLWGSTMILIWLMFSLLKVYLLSRCTVRVIILWFWVLCVS